MIKIFILILHVSDPLFKKILRKYIVIIIIIKYGVVLS
jgi:hypothetical protein